jgi:hypothetical protein
VAVTTQLTVLVEVVEMRLTLVTYRVRLKSAVLVTVVEVDGVVVVIETVLLVVTTVLVEVATALIVVVEVTVEMGMRH